MSDVGVGVNMPLMGVVTVLGMEYAVNISLGNDSLMNWCSVPIPGMNMHYQFAQVDGPHPIISIEAWVGPDNTVATPEDWIAARLWFVSHAIVINVNENDPVYTVFRDSIFLGLERIQEFLQQ